MLTLQILKLMDIIWKSEGLDMKFENFIKISQTKHKIILKIV